jgi:hypothetical protein
MEKISIVSRAFLERLGKQNAKLSVNDFITDLKSLNNATLEKAPEPAPPA